LNLDTSLGSIIRATSAVMRGKRKTKEDSHLNDYSLCQRDVQSTTLCSCTLAQMNMNDTGFIY